MTALVVIVSRVLGDGSDERFSPQEDHLIETLDLIDLTNRSAYAFMFGAWYAVSRTSTPESQRST